jgi:hypothetical protein
MMGIEKEWNGKRGELGKRRTGKKKNGEGDERR